MEIADDEILGAKRNIKAEDLAEAGPVVLTVKGAHWAEFPNAKTGKVDRKQVIEFDDGREVTLNATRSEQLGEMFGKPVKLSAAKGQQIRLYTAKVQGPNGKVVSIQFGKPDGTPF